MKRIQLWLPSLIILIIWLSIFVVVRYNDPKITGVIGDTFGIVNSLFTGLGLTGVIISISLQSKQFKKQIEDSSEQKKFNDITVRISAYTTLLTLYKEQLNSTIDNFEKNKLKQNINSVSKKLEELLKL